MHAREGASLEITAAAAARIAEAAAAAGPDAVLRISVAAGGCSGFRYVFAVEPRHGPEDLVFRMHGAAVAVDPVSIALLDGAVLDYRESLTGGGLSVNNPKAAASCGCGASFAAD